MCWWQPEAASGNTKAFHVPPSAEAEQLFPGDRGRGSPGFVSLGSEAVLAGRAQYAHPASVGVWGRAEGSEAWALFAAPLLLTPAQE